MTPELISLTQAAGLTFTGLATAMAALILMSMRPSVPKSEPIAPQTPEVTFLFDGDLLVDATESARRLLDLTESHGTDINRLAGFLSPRFPDLHDRVMQCREPDSVELISSDGLSTLKLAFGAGRLRITLEERDRTAVVPAPDRHSLAALSEELQMHRALGAGMPFPVWRQTGDGRVVWANAHYRDLVEKLDTAMPGTLHPPKIFEVEPIDSADQTGIQRTRLELPHEAEPRWYEYQVRRIDTDLLVAAIPVDRVVHAERSLHDFIQTLTQTFAHLNVGLAIFNRNREMAIFNPALTDLLRLPPEFLITRPTLFQVFDRLRDHRLMPEPKNYRNWRQQMSELEAAAVDGVYSETWSLVDGRTYRVTGRPHPEGAVAFLFEDISAEISQERRFRTELKLGQAVIDGLEEAIAVFSPSGALAMSNRAYGELWMQSPETAAKEATILEASRKWQKDCAPTPVWGDARDFVATIGERSNWNCEVRMRDGRRLDCRFDTMPGGCTLVGFSIQREIPRAVQPASLAPARA